MKNNQYNNFNDAVTLFLRKVIIIFLIVTLLMFVCFTSIYIKYEINSIKYLMCMYTLQHALWLFGFIYFKDMSIETFVRVYLSYMIVAFYPIVCMFWNSGSPVVFFWYLLVLFGAIIFDNKNISIWVLIISVIVISIFFCSSLFPHENMLPQVMSLLNMLTVVATVILASFFSIVHEKISKIEEFVNDETLRTEAENMENLEKDKALYNEIIKYLEEKKPFKNPDFNAQALAKALNSNMNYISKAISAGGNGDFHTLLNNFRINYAKSMFDNGAMKKYTVDYVYTEAGYKHRSTFNAAFKNITGMTPSDYISQQNTSDNS